MNRRPVSNPDLAALGAFQGTIDRASNFRDQAMNHNLGRNVRVVKLLGFLSLLKQNGIALTGNVECIAAEPQNFSSPKNMTLMGLPTGHMEAAHFLPGRVRIGGLPFWQIPANSSTGDQIEFLFAEVEHLPVAFNQADTVAEAKLLSDGLCAALVHAFNTLIRGQAASSVAGRISLDLLRPAYDDWCRDAITALTSAIAKKSAKPGIPPLVGNAIDGYSLESVSARSTAGASKWNRDNSLQVLRYYLEDQQARNWAWVQGSCQSALGEVESQFKG